MVDSVNELKELAEKSVIQINRQRRIDALLNGIEYIPITKEETKEWVEYQRLFRVFYDVMRLGIQ